MVDVDNWPVIALDGCGIAQGNSIWRGSDSLRTMLTTARARK